MNRKNQAGKAVTFHYTGMVQKNDLIGVHHAYEVQILFVVNSFPQEWKSAAKGVEFYHNSWSGWAEKKKEGVENIIGANADLCEFPFYPTTFLNYSPIAVNALSQLASWQILQCREELERMGFIA
jgi:hypothetical protein